MKKGFGLCQISKTNPFHLISQDTVIVWKTVFNLSRDSQKILQDEVVLTLYVIDKRRMPTRSSNMYRTNGY
jgi:hypothetical protein